MDLNENKKNNKKLVNEVIKEEPVIDEENTTPPQTEAEIIDPNPEVQNEPENELNE